VFTIVQNEPVFLPIWERYYRRYFDPDDLFVLDHDSQDATTLAVARRSHRVPIHRHASFDHEWLRGVVHEFQQFLLRSYELVLFVEVDEIVATDPAHVPGGLREYVETFPADVDVRRCNGWNVVQHPDEPAIDWSRPILGQRAYGVPSPFYCKPLLSRIALDWAIGFHSAANVSADPETIDPRLLLLHLHRADFAYCRERHQANAARTWSAADLATGVGRHNRIVDEDALRAWFYPIDIMPLPERWREIVV
jgi:hypothetical protein